MTEASTRGLGVSNSWLVTAILSLGGLLASFMQTLIFPIVGKLPIYLDTSADNASWVVTAALLTAAVAMPVSGRLADMSGKRRAIFLCITSMMIGSLVCALTGHVTFMILGRAMQGLAMGLIPVGISLLRDLLPRDRVPAAVAFLSATMGVGSAIALPVSAWIVQMFDWHMLFWTSAVTSLIVLVLIRIFVAESPLRSPGKFDVVGALGLSASLLCILLPISKGATWGWSSPLTLSLFGASVVFVLLWAGYELRHSAPLIDLRVAAEPVILTTNVSSILLGFSMMAFGLLGPQILQVPHIPGVTDWGMALSLTATGLVLAPGGLAMMFLSPVSGHFNVSIGPRLTLGVGGLVMAGGYLFMALLMTEPWQILVAEVIICAGIGLAYSAMPALIMSAAPEEQTAAVNSLNALMRSGGTSTASAVVPVVLATSVIDIGDGKFVPSESSFMLALLIGCIVAMVGALVAFAIPYRHSAAPAGPAQRGGTSMLPLHGRPSPVPRADH